MYREQYGEYAYWCLGEEEEEDLYLFRVSHSDALRTAILIGALIKIKMVWTSQSCWNITSTGKPLEKLS